MTSNVVNQVAYLRTSRDFPEEAKQLSVELSKSYIDIANSVNSRTIGIYPSSRPSVTGESWFIANAQKQQTLRQVYPLTSSTAVPHGITFNNIYGFSRMYGTYTDGTSWYGLIAGTSTAIAGQIVFYLTSTNITFVVGAGAPALTKGFVVLEWLSNT